MSQKRIVRERQRAIQEVLVRLFGILLCSGKSDDEVRECAISSIEAAEKMNRGLLLPYVTTQMLKTSAAS